jgi:hypothetical protein
LNEERRLNERYTIGITIQQFKNFRSPNPNVKYRFNIGSKELKDFEEIPNYLHQKIITSGGRYYVQYSSKNPGNRKLMLGYPVPDSIKIAPAEGWDYMPGYEK